MKTTELIERYVHAVGNDLPRKLRADVQLELRSLLEEMVEERAALAKSEPTEEMIVEVLHEFGEPEAVAAGYQPPQYLIGPDYYPYFIFVLRIALAFVGVVFLIGLTVGIVWSRESADLPGFVWEWVSRFGQYALINTGLVVTIFVILERLFKRRQEKTASWDPLALPAVEDPNRINRSSLLDEIGFSAVFITLLNAFPNWIGIIYRDEGSWQVFPLLAPEFSVHIPWLTLLWGAGILLNLVVLQQGRWQRPTRLAQFGLSLFGTVVLYRLITGGAIATLAVLTLIAKAAFTIMLIVLILEVITQLYQLFTARSVELIGVKMRDA